MKQLLLVFLGGGTGSLLRYLISRRLSEATILPLGTLVVNIVGSLAIGFILGFAGRSETLSHNSMLLLATGLCGGFTTFSTFVYENQVFLRSGDFLSTGIYTISSIILGLAAVFVGVYLTSFFE